MNLWLFATLAAAALAAVIEATDKDLDTYLASGVPTVLFLWATWCHHCEGFHSKYDALSAEFEHLQDRMQFVKVNVDKSRKTSKRFNVEYVPTLKFIDGDKIEEINSRDVGDIKKFLKKAAGVEPSTPATAKKPARRVSRESMESHVLNLIDDTFAEAVIGKNALVAFTTTWCHYCKELAPKWADLSKLYARDEDLVIANVDCTDAELSYSLMEAYGVEAFPTIVYVPAEAKDESLFEPYNGPREVESFVNFIKSKGISHRDASGSLDATAGLIKDLDFTVLPNYKKLAKQVAKSSAKNSDIYLRILDRAAQDAGYIDKEASRIDSMLESGALKPGDADSFKVRQNILNSLRQTTEKSEL